MPIFLKGQITNNASGNGYKIGFDSPPAANLKTQNGKFNYRSVQALEGIEQKKSFYVHFLMEK
jgi:hypothetical protein